ncbi:MAG: hypothetical protein ACK54L_02650, partial [Betaproteobacteria bacterium]
VGVIARDAGYAGCVGALDTGFDRGRIGPRYHGSQGDAGLGIDQRRPGLLADQPPKEPVARVLLGVAAPEMLKDVLGELVADPRAALRRLVKAGR